MAITEQTRKKMRLAKLGTVGYWRGKKRPTGALSANWKGNKVGYQGIHDWIRSVLGTPDTCEECHTSGLTGYQIHWANVSGKYKREISNWKRLCIRCHFRMDDVITKSWRTRKAYAS